MSDDDREQREPDSRERAQLLRAVAHHLRVVDPADLDGPQLEELLAVIPRRATGGGLESNVYKLPIRPGPDSGLRRLRLSFQALAADAERTADEIDRRLDEAGFPPADAATEMIVESITEHDGSVLDRSPLRVREIQTADAVLFAPKVRYVSTGESQFDAMMTWRAELELAYLADGESTDVLAGYAEFLTIRIGEHPIVDLLDSLSADTEHLAGLFDDDDVNDALQEQFDDVPFNRILIVTMVSVARPLRGHDLGAWLVSEVIARMAGAIDTLVLLDPSPADVDWGGVTVAQAAANAMAKYWRRVGLVPIDGHPEVLGQSTGYTALPGARDMLKSVKDVEIPVSARQMLPEQPSAPPRCTLIEH